MSYIKTMQENLNRAKGAHRSHRKRLDDVSDDILARLIKTPMTADRRKEQLIKLKAIILEYRTVDSHTVNVADDIIEGWVALNEACEADANLSADWDDFLVVMKMLD